MMSGPLAALLKAPLAALLAMGAAPTAFEQARDGEPVMQAEVQAAADDTYRASLSLNEDAPVWIFLRSGVTREEEVSWRTDHIEVLTPGVELVRIGFHDALIASDGGPVPREIRIAMQPFTGNLIADYQPAIRLGAEAMAIFSDHFTLRPASSLAAVQGLGTDWTTLPDYEGAHPLVWFKGDGFPIIAQEGGERFAPEAASYIVHGSIDPVRGDSLTSYIDPSLPDWLEEKLRSEVPLVLDLFAERLGPHEEDYPQLLVSWTGPTLDRVGLGGGVIGAQIVMQIEGEALLTPSPMAGARARRFIAHEAAHYWLGNIVDYGRSSDAWTSEGGADLMALRAGEVVDTVNGAAQSRRDIRGAPRRCLALSDGQPLATAPERGAYEAHYECGVIFALVAEAAARRAGGDFFTFWRQLIDLHREDGSVTAQDWLDHYLAIGGSAEAARLIQLMLTGPGISTDRLRALYLETGLAMPPSLQRPQDETITAS